MARPLTKVENKMLDLILLKEEISRDYSKLVSDLISELPAELSKLLFIEKLESLVEKKEKSLELYKDILKKFKPETDKGEG